MSTGIITANWIHEPIHECGEPLVMLEPRFIPPGLHIYQTQGAVYPEGASPYMLRKGAFDRLVLAQTALDVERPGYKILVADAYRPLEVQAQMVEIHLRNIAPRFGYDPDNLTPEQKQDMMSKDGYWANPTKDKTRPHSHGTGGSVDVYIINGKGVPLLIDPNNHVDAFSETSAVDYYKDSKDPVEQEYHDNRMLLQRVMEKGGFIHNPREPWHFDFGNQRWAHFMRVLKRKSAQAMYGRVDFVEKTPVFQPPRPA